MVTEVTYLRTYKDIVHDENYFSNWFINITIYRLRQYFYDYTVSLWNNNIINKAHINKTIYDWYD
jgi:hypothetical protein